MRWRTLKFRRLRLQGLNADSNADSWCSVGTNGGCEHSVSFSFKCACVFPYAGAGDRLESNMQLRGLYGELGTCFDLCY